MKSSGSLGGEFADWRIVVTGARGLIGRALCASLRAKGAQVVELAHRPREGVLCWDIERKVLDAQALEGCDAVVHLAGETIAGRWSAEKKRRIARSRIEGTDLLAQTLIRLERKPRVWVSASAVGYYGADAGVVDESAPVGEGFLAEVCALWEGAAAPARKVGVRVVYPRLGMVLARKGGTLARMVPVFRLGLGGCLGHGRQGVSWIALEDAVGLIEFALMKESIEGRFNATAPEGVDNAMFTRTLAAVLGSRACLPLPTWLLRMVFGEMAQELLLADVQAVPRVALEAGFAFRQPRLEGALRDLLEHGGEE